MWQRTFTLGLQVNMRWYVGSSSLSYKYMRSTPINKWYRTNCSMYLRLKWGGEGRVGRWVWSSVSHSGGAHPIHRSRSRCGNPIETTTKTNAFVSWRVTPCISCWAASYGASPRAMTPNASLASVTVGTCSLHDPIA